MQQNKLPVTQKPPPTTASMFIFSHALSLSQSLPHGPKEKWGNVNQIYSFFNRSICDGARKQSKLGISTCDLICSMLDNSLEFEKLFRGYPRKVEARENNLRLLSESCGPKLAAFSRNFLSLLEGGRAEFEKMFGSNGIKAGDSVQNVLEAADLLGVFFRSTMSKLPVKGMSMALEE